MIESAVTELTAVVGTTGACAAVGRPRATHYRRLMLATPGPRLQPRALGPDERQQVLDVLHSQRFLDMAPPSVYATLLDEGTYVASVPTMYGILRSADEVRERRVWRHPPYVKPELIAWRPNMTWSWDITKLLGPAKWTYYYLYVVLDIYSRYVVGWMLASRELAALAERSLADSIRKPGCRARAADYPRRSRLLDDVRGCRSRHGAAIDLGIVELVRAAATLRAHDCIP